MLSITSLQADPLTEPAPRWEYWLAPCAVLVISVLLYLAQHKTNVVWFRVFCWVEFAFVIFTFCRFAKKQTKREANLFNFAWMAASGVTQLMHVFFFLP